jgi:hypothetical protein
MDSAENAAIAEARMILAVVFFVRFIENLLFYNCWITTQNKILRAFGKMPNA